MVSRVSKMRKSGEASELEELLNRYNIELPPDILDFWKNAAYVDSGVIAFDDPKFNVGGYWVWRKDKPFYIDELKKALENYLFNNNPNFSVKVCPPPEAMCEFDKEEGRIILDFEVWDNRRGEPIFDGTAYILLIDSFKDGYIETKVIGIDLWLHVTPEPF